MFSASRLGLRSTTSVLAAEFRRFESSTHPKIGRIISNRPEVSRIVLSSEKDLKKVPAKLTSPALKLPEEKSEQVSEEKSKKVFERKNSKKSLFVVHFKCPHCSFSDESKISVKQVKQNENIRKLMRII